VCAEGGRTKKKQHALRQLSTTLFGKLLLHEETISWLDGWRGCEGGGGSGHLRQHLFAATTSYHPHQASNERAQTDGGHYGHHHKADHHGGRRIGRCDNGGACVLGSGGRRQ